MLRRTGWLFVAILAVAVRLPAQDAAVETKAKPKKPESKFFDSDGVKIHYFVKGEGEPVILVHGFTASALLNWIQPGVFDALAEDYQVIAIDNRGHGRSDKPHDPEQYGVEMVEDVVRLMDHLGIEKAHVAGYSMGGFITCKLLATHPDRLLSATLGGAGWRRDTDDVDGLLNELAESLEQGKGIGPLIRRLTPEGQPEPSEEQIAAMSQVVLLMNDAKALAAVARGMAGLTVSESELKANKVPTLALIGETDPLKAGVDEMAPVTENLEVVVIEDADHMSAFGRPEFLEGLQKFLAAQRQTAEAAAK